MSPHLETLKYTCLERCCTLVVVFKFIILNSKQLEYLCYFDFKGCLTWLPTGYKKAAKYDRQTVSPSKCPFKPCLTFCMMNSTFASVNSVKTPYLGQHRGRCAELARRATLWCFPNEVFVQNC
jgi:hypothetical protein